MFRALLNRLRASDRQDRASILLPFLIISIGLGVLAWRSYQLSARLEADVNTLAAQYAGYAADITARRIDTAVQTTLIQAAEEWRNAERRLQVPTSAALQDWLKSHDWIISAIYVPDYDPASSIFVTALGDRPVPKDRLTREFYTSSGLVRYTYEPTRLIEEVLPALQRQPLVRNGPMQPEAQLAIMETPNKNTDQRLTEGFAHIAPLATPLTGYSVRAFVRTNFGTSGWENARYISVWLSVVAVALTALGALLALRGLKREAETMKLRTALIANVSHELRTPLSMLRLGAETLKRSAKLTETQRLELEDAMLREVLHLSHMVENVLDVARMQNRSTKALAFTPVRPRELVTSLVSTYESWIRSKGFEIALQIEENVDEQLWDRDAVSRAVLNLIDNAVKYSGETKSLTVVLRQTDMAVLIEVRDCGIGIHADDLSRIFEPYYRAQFSDTQTRRGAGLGLTLVQQIVTSHGGRVEVESTPGTGSTFRLLFPRGNPPRSHPAPALTEEIA
ncbi:MAG TPA: HAMP domain-containing sensor histidine kinase [Thermoanaerobaculia bacterium]|nr:HAMP domain-containing sensor histidine kinase [Thermoanaerobaculia bacterium]